MTDIVKGMARELIGHAYIMKLESILMEFVERDYEGGMRAALLWFAERLEAGDKICDPVGDAFWNCIDPFYKSGRQTQIALAAAIRAAAGDEGK